LTAFSQPKTEADNGFQVLSDDGDRIFCRERRKAVGGARKTVPAVLPTVAQPSPAALERLAHEYALRDELNEGAAVRSLKLCRARARGCNTPVLKDPGREPLEALGPNGWLMVDNVPELELIPSEQPLVPELAPQDAQRGFQPVSRRLIGVFARRAGLYDRFPGVERAADAGVLAKIGWR
jgi:hypothetical protein